MHNTTPGSKSRIFKFGRRYPFGMPSKNMPEGIPFAMSGFKCTGSETRITDCPHDATVSPQCGTNGTTSGSNTDIVGVECE